MRNEERGPIVDVLRSVAYGVWLIVWRKSCILWMLDGASLWSNSTPLPAALLAWYGEDREDGLKISSKTGDIDGDGLNDLLVLQDEWEEGNGRVFVLLSSDW